MICVVVSISASVQNLAAHIDEEDYLKYVDVFSVHISNVVNHQEYLSRYAVLTLRALRYESGMKVK